MTPPADMFSGKSLLLLCHMFSAWKIWSLEMMLTAGVGHSQSHARTKGQGPHSSFKEGKREDKPYSKPVPP